MSSMASLTTITSNAILPSATLNGNNTTIRNFVNASCLKNDEAGTITSTTANQFTVAYDGSNSLIVNVSSGGVVTLTPTTSLAVAKATTFSSTLSAVGITSTGDITATDASVTVNATGTTNRTVVMQLSGVLKALVGVAPQANALVTGAATGDLVIRSQSLSIRLSVDGATSALTIGASNAASFSGTVGVTGDFAVNTNKFTVAASSGNTAIAGTLTSGAITAPSATFAGVTTIGSSASISTTLACGSDFTVNTNKFTVNATNGNTVVAGTLSLSGKLTTFASALGASGINIPSGTTPSSPNDGDFWYDGTNLKFRAAGTTRTITWT